MSIRRFSKGLLGVGVFMALAAMSPEPLLAAEAVKVSGAWIRFAPPTLKVHGAYLAISNPGGKPRNLVGVETPAYARAEIHVSGVQDGVATMQKLEQVTVPAGKSVAFEPGGLHLMLVEAKAPLKVGESVPFTLLFGNGDKIKVTAVVKRSAGTKHHHHGHAGHGHKKSM